jgi:signal transduction histidine kinase
VSTAQREVAASAAIIRRLPLFEGLAAADVERIAAMARRLRVGAGAVVMQEGTAGDGLYIILEGQLEVRRREGAQELVLAVRGPGEFLGELSLLEQAPRSASVVAVTDGELLVLHPADFQALLADSPAVLRTVLGTVVGRLRSTESTLMEREKLAALGTMAAGLAHELNNPAAAVSRAAEHLRDVIAHMQHATMEVSTLALSPAQARRLDELAADVGTCLPSVADPLACSLEEDAITQWLEARGVERAWDVAAPLVAFGWTRVRMEQLAADFAPARTAPVVEWLSARLAARGLLEEVDRSAEAISSIVRAVKNYAYLDQAPVQEVDVADSLDNTLVILRHRLKQGVEVVRDYDAHLPRIEAYGSELNQVWTNLIGNAIDAMDGHGSVTVRTRGRDDGVTIEIIDSGPGIPDGIRSRLFEPFFTTKPPGVGSGLGLHIAYNIIVNRHHGRIHVDSEPGRTRFCVTLPLRLQRVAG